MLTDVVAELADGSHVARSHFDIALTWQTPYVGVMKLAATGLVIAMATLARHEGWPVSIIGGDDYLAAHRDDVMP